MEYSYCPNLERKPEKLLRNAGFLLGILLLSTSFFPNVPLPWLLRFLSILFLASGVALQMLLARSYCYRMTSEELFEVEERIGQRRQVVCRVAKSEIEVIKPCGSREVKESLNEQDRKHYSYTGTIKKDGAYWLFATVSGEKLAVCILADERLLALLSA